MPKNVPAILRAGQTWSAPKLAITLGASSVIVALVVGLSAYVKAVKTSRRQYTELYHAKVRMLVGGAVETYRRRIRKKLHPIP